MPISKTLLLLLAVSIVPSSSPASPAAGPSRGNCWPKGSATVLANANARVYKRAAPSTAAHDHYVYSCSYATDKRVRLGGSSCIDDPVPLFHGARLSGRHLAYIVKSCRGAQSLVRAAIRVLDTSSGKRRAIGRVIGSGCPPPLLARVEVTGYALQPNGSAAWLAGIDCVRGGEVVSGDTEVRRWTPSAGSVTLASGSEIDRDSFGAGDKRIYWQKAGVAESSHWR